MIKLESYLKSGPVDVEYISHVGPFQKTSKKGNTFAAYTYTFRLRSTGETFEQMLFDSEHRKIGYVGPNALIRIMAKGNGYLDYIVLPVGEASMNVPQQKNTAQVAKERQITQVVQEQSLEQKARQKQISLAGVYQARLSSGMETEKAREAAISDVAWLERTAANLAVNDGFNQEPEFAPELVHKPSVTIDEVNHAFGQSL